MKRYNESSLFELVYLFVSIATFIHTTWGSAFTFEGDPPQKTLALAFWYLTGMLVAITVDVGMFLTARAMKHNRSLVLVATFILAAFSSYFFQVLYTLHHADEFVWGGVRYYWIARLQPLVDARVVIVPGFLPLFAILYTMAKIRVATEEKAQTTTIQGVQVSTYTLNNGMKALITPEKTYAWVCPDCNKTLGSYTTEAILKSVISNHKRTCKNHRHVHTGEIVG